MIKEKIIKHYELHNFHKQAIETEKVLQTMKLNSDNYNLDSRIKHLEKNKIKVKYKGL